MDDFFSSKFIGAGRKAYHCDQCRGVIEKGARHVAIAQRSIGILSSQRLHLACAQVAGVLPVESTKPSLEAAAP